MGECEKCGFLECRCPDHVAQNYVPKYKLRQLVERMELIATDKKWGDLGEDYKMATADWAVELKNLLSKPKIK